jgi:hypothetical protein
LAGAADVAAGVAEEALSDAVLRRAGRADPEDVTMGFLREARSIDDGLLLRTNELRKERRLMRCACAAAHRHRPERDRAGTAGTTCTHDLHG